MHIGLRAPSPATAGRRTTRFRIPAVTYLSTDDEGEDDEEEDDDDDEDEEEGEEKKEEEEGEEEGEADEDGDVVGRDIDGLANEAKVKDANEDAS
jgi:hypothetical protein